MQANTHTINKAPATKEQLGTLFSMTWPMLLGVLSLMSFQLVDSIFISRLGIAPLAVVGFTIPIYQVIIGIQVGIGIATTALISQRLGAEQDGDANQLASSVLIFGAILMVVLVLALWIFRADILALMDGDAALLPLLEEFWSVWLFAAFTGAFLYFGYSICRAHGNTLLPGVLMIITSLLNIALDPIFIFSLNFGLQGAAIATLVSFGFGIVIVYPRIIRQRWLGFTHHVAMVISHSKEIVSIALPAMVSQLMPSLAAIAATGLVAGYGTEAVAAWGLGVRIEFFSLVLVLALTMSMPPMIGRYYGGKNFDAINALVRLGVKVILLTQLVLALLIALVATPLSLFMADAEEVATLLELYLVFMPFSYSSLGVCILMVSMSNAVSQSMRALAISIIRLFVCYLPLLYLGSWLAGFTGIIAGGALGNLLAGWVAWNMFHAGIKKASSH